jgi:hypothetical protein
MVIHRGGIVFELTIQTLGFLKRALEALITSCSVGRLHAMLSPNSLDAPIVNQLLLNNSFARALPFDPILSDVISVVVFITFLNDDAKVWKKVQSSKRNGLCGCRCRPWRARRYSLDADSSASARTRFESHASS